MTSLRNRNRTRTRKREPPKDEAEFLSRYRPGDFPRPSVAVDLVVLTLIDATLHVLLVRRREHPFKGAWALPGGFVRVGLGDGGDKDQGEDVDAAAARELEEETGLPASAVYLEQLYTFGDAGRDPRMRVITVAYFALIRPDLAPRAIAGGDVDEVEWVPIGKLAHRALAFDHAFIIERAIERIAGKIDYTDVAFELVPQTFTIPELRAVHEAVKGGATDKGNFRRRFVRMMEDGLIEEAPGKRLTASKPAKVYRFRRARK